jgi:hypothetical protein
VTHDGGIVCITVPPRSDDEVCALQCISCDAVLPPDAQFCPDCGTEQNSAATGPTQRLAPPHTMGSLMQQGICSNCAAHTVFVDTALPELVQYNHESGNSIVVACRVVLAPIRVLVTHYVCVTCGYMQSYIHDSEDLAIIRERWTQVDPEQ